MALDLEAKGSALLKLPPELRNRIYEYVLISSEHVVVHTHEKHSWSAPPLLQTCRKMRDEAAGIYYGGNTFECGTILPELFVSDWLIHIGKKQQSIIRRLCINEQGFDHDEAVVAAFALREYADQLAEEGVEISEDALYISVGKRCASQEEERSYVWHALKELESAFGRRTPRSEIEAVLKT